MPSKKQQSNFTDKQLGIDANAGLSWRNRRLREVRAKAIQIILISGGKIEPERLQKQLKAAEGVELELWRVKSFYNLVKMQEKEGLARKASIVLEIRTKKLSLRAASRIYGISTDTLRTWQQEIEGQKSSTRRHKSIEQLEKARDLVAQGFSDRDTICRLVECPKGVAEMALRLAKPWTKWHPIPFEPITDEEWDKIRPILQKIANRSNDWLRHLCNIVLKKVHNECPMERAADGQSLIWGPTASAHLLRWREAGILNDIIAIKPIPPRG